MRKIIGIVLIIIGVFIGFYVGLWQCFIMGIVGIIDAIRSPQSISSMELAISIAKVLFAGFLGWIAGIIPGAIGFYLVVED